MKKIQHIPHHLNPILSSLIVAFMLMFVGIHISLSAQTVTTQVTLSIVHSYSGDTQLFSAPSLGNRGSGWYTSSPVVPLTVHTSASTDWFAQGDVLSGQSLTGLVPPLSTGTVVLTSGDGLKLLSGYLLRWGQERIDTSSHHIFLDTQGPSAPSLLTPVSGYNHTLSGPLSLSWTPSIDVGVGLSGYQVVLARDPLLALPFASIQANGASVTVPAATRSSGAVYWAVIAYDYLGNYTMSSIGYWNHGGSGSTGGGGSSGGGSHSSAGGGGYVLIKDDCDIDLSPSYYDRICGSVDVDSSSDGGGSHTAVGDGFYTLLLGPHSYVHRSPEGDDTSSAPVVPESLLFDSVQEVFDQVPPVQVGVEPSDSLDEQDMESGRHDMIDLSLSMQWSTRDILAPSEYWVDRFDSRTDDVPAAPFSSQSAQMYVYRYYAWHPAFWNRRIKGKIIARKRLL